MAKLIYLKDIFIQSDGVQNKTSSEAVTQKMYI